MIHEKTLQENLQHQQQKVNQDQTENNTAILSAFASLAQLLSGQQEDNQTASVAKPSSAMIPSPMYECPSMY